MPVSFLTLPLARRSEEQEEGRTYSIAWLPPEALLLSHGSEQHQLSDGAVIETAAHSDVSKKIIE